ncbi:MAG: RsmE family RNA methyltransferase [Mycobacteriales bacterium]
MSRPAFVAVLSGELGPVALAPEEAHHAAEVRRLRLGEQVRLTDGAGRLADATVSELGRRRCVCTVTASWIVPPAAPRVSVALAVLKGERMMRAVEALTEAGADQILPWTAERTVSVRSAEPGHARARWVAAARSAAKQSGRAYFPQVEPTDLAGVLAQARDSRVFLCQQGADVPLAGAGVPAGGELLIVVGPEGGLTEGEHAELTAAGAESVRLGPQVLRAGTAALAALVLVNAGSGRWGRLSSAP